MITVNQLHYTYPGRPQPALKNLTFEVRPGEIFGFLGPSGAGKSTTQKILNGLLRGYSGSAQVFGREMSQWGADYYEKIGVAFELPYHYLKLTGRENLRRFSALYQTTTLDPQTALEMVGLGADGDLPVSQYSKGMKNRLSLARALLHRPPLLFLDEPTSGLDPVNSEKIQKLIQQLQAEGRTIFLTTHDMAIANELCGRVAFVVEGEIRLTDTPQALRLRYGRPTVALTYHEQGQLQQAEWPLVGLSQNHQFQTLLANNAIQTLHTQEATLAEVFIQATGRELA